MSQQVLAKYVVQPNRDDPTDNYLDTRAHRFQNNGYNIRLDRSWGNGTSLFTRYSLSDETGFTPQNLPGFGAYHDNRVHNLTVTLLRPTIQPAVDRDALRFRANAHASVRRIGERHGPSSENSGSPASDSVAKTPTACPLFDIQGYDPIGDSLLCTPCQYWNNNFPGRRARDVEHRPSLDQVRRRRAQVQLGHARVFPEPRLLPVHHSDYESDVAARRHRQRVRELPARARRPSRSGRPARHRWSCGR